MIIKSLLDNDFYKFTMMQGYHKLGLASTEAEYKFVDRNNTVYTREQYDQIKREIEKLETLRFTQEELDYMASLDVFDNDFVYGALADFKLPVQDTMKINYNGGNIDIRFKGNLPEVSMFEIYVMAIVAETFCYGQESANLINGSLELADKFNNVDDKNGLKVVDFGSRRRYSQEWHEDVVTYLKDNPNFAGTSNVYLAKKIGQKPIGTMAHEWFQVHQGLYDVVESQVKALENWDKVYPNAQLGIALTDIFNMDTFVKDFTKNENFSDSYFGLRQDSGDPPEWAEKAMKLLKEQSDTLEGKTLVFSDGLTIDKALDIQKSLEDENGNLPVNVVFGIGTKLTNNVGAKAPNIVIKNTMTNGQPTVKISDEPGKTICEDKDYINMVQDKMKDWPTLSGKKNKFTRRP